MQKIEREVEKIPVTCGVAEAARVLGIGESNMRKFVVSGEIKSYLIGRRRLVPGTEIAAFIERQMAAAAAEGRGA